MARYEINPWGYRGKNHVTKSRYQTWILIKSGPLQNQRMIFGTNFYDFDMILFFCLELGGKQLCKNTCSALIL